MKPNILLDYLTLCKPKVVLLMLITFWVGMQLTAEQKIPLTLLITSSLGIIGASSAAAVINHILDRKIDAKMQRTKERPIANGRITPKKAITFAIILATIALIILLKFVNTITAILTFATLFSYAILYTVYLKYATPQNIVIGGAAGAMPPLLGSVAVTGQVSAESLLLVILVYLWTPPHFWALAIWRLNDYQKTKIPMLPVTHGIEFTKLCILLYSILMFIASILPYLIGMSGNLYLVLSVPINLYFIYLSLTLFKEKNPSKINIIASGLFRYSILYLILLFLALLIDHYLILYLRNIAYAGS